MNFQFSYESEFTILFESLKSKYGLKIFDIDGIGKQLDVNAFSKEFFTNKTVADSSIDSNANVDTNDVISFTFELPKAFMKVNSYYMLWKKLKSLYGKEEANRIMEMQIGGDIYINDSTDLGRPYCFNYSLFDIAIDGLPMIKKIKSIAPKYLTSFKSQVEQFLVIASNSTLGATGMADLFIVMAWYVDQALETKSDSHFKFASEEDVWIYTKEQIVSLIYTINQPQRGNQSPFTNVSVYDKYFLESLLSDGYELHGRKPKIETIQKIQKIYLDIINREMERTPITFPVTTACFSVDEDKNIRDDEFARMIAEKDKKFGFINIYSGSTSTLSSCCRLRSNTDNKEYFNAFGSGSTKIGSLGVVTMNLPRIAIKAKREATNGDVEQKFYSYLEDLVIVAAKINNAKRHIIQKRIDLGRMPLYSLGFMNIKSQYSTSGVTGINESCEILGYDILNEYGQTFVLNCMDIMNMTNDRLQKKYNAPHNVEQVPAENSSIKLANKDKLLGYHNGVYKFYSNQFIPLVTSADVLDRIKIQGIYDQHFSGGAILHINVGHKIDDADIIYSLIKTCAKKGVIYWAINYNIQRCENDHITIGQNGKCDICGADIKDNFTRVVGFLTTTKNWHKTRREFDYPKRKWYNGESKVVGQIVT